MVSVSQLLNAKPSEWTSAADDWNNLLKLTRQSSIDIRDRGQGKVDEHWQDKVGQRASGKMGDLADQFDIASYTCSSVSMILDGLSTAVQLAQQTLQGAKQWAGRLGLEVDDDGTVKVEDGGPEGGKAEAHLSEVQSLVTEALTAATFADEEAADEFNKLAGQVNSTDPNDALNNVQSEASNDELTMIAGTIPSNASSDQVAAWWKSLTPQQQTELENAAPTTLYGLNGIPQNVKDQLAGPGRFNRMKFVQFAEDNWNTNAGNYGYGRFQKDSCTSFTSTAMHAAGVSESGDWHGTGSWSIFGKVDAWESSPTWGAAQNYHDFLTSHGGQEIASNQAKPGDVIFWQSDSDGPDGFRRIHHTAIVTAVSPDGDIRYTQHSGGMLNASLNGRSQYVVDSEGKQHYVIVRPNANGY